MDDQELATLLADLESDRAERKASASDGKKIREAICAFANDLPNHRRSGVIFVGVHDDGSCAGLVITDQLLLTLSDMRQDGNITPFPVMTVQKRNIGGCDLAAIVVSPSDSTPVRYQGRTWIRVGPRRAIASAEEERRLTEKRRAGDHPFDLRPVSGATVLDLDMSLFAQEYLPAALPADILEQNERTPEQRLASMRFLTLAGVATVTGILVLGKEPRRFLPGAYVQFLRIDGTDLTEPIKDQAEIDGPLPILMRRLDDKIQAHISVSTDLQKGPVEIRHPDYPIVAIQQLVRNALFHRTYEGTNAPVRLTWFSDRIEIVSPGGPFGQVTRQNFGTPGVTDYRNPHLAEPLKALGYVQRFGVGIQLARKELQKNGNPPPEFSAPDDAYLLAVLRRRP